MQRDIYVLLAIIQYLTVLNVMMLITAIFVKLVFTLICMQSQKTKKIVSLVIRIFQAVSNAVFKVNAMSVG